MFVCRTIALSIIRTNSLRNHLYRIKASSLITTLTRQCHQDSYESNGDSDSDTGPMELKSVVRKLDSLAPPSLAGSWDNVGLLVEPTAPFEVKRVLLTNDLTEPVLEEAISKTVNLILSYHPPIFKPLTRLTRRNWKERIVVRCLENRIAVYSPHTAYDAVKGGVNDWLISPFCEESGVLEAVKHPMFFTSGGQKMEVTVPNNTLSEFLAKMAAIPGITLLSNVRSCQGEDEEASRLSFNCTEKAVPKAVECVDGYETIRVTMELIQLTKPPIPGHGPGRLGKLANPISVQQAIESVKSHLNLPYLRLALANGAALDSKIKTVAVCAGSGSSVLRGVKADLHLTGEMSHHEVLDANHGGTSVILCDHSNTERGYLAGPLKAKLRDLLVDEVKIIMSETDRDPMVIV